ncbi:MAG: hypothetical protein AAF211_05550 [Myxococcota bacterium]
MLLWGIALGIGCNSTITNTVDRCSVDITSVVPATARPGDTVRIEGEGPFVDQRDTAVFVGGVRATVVSVNGGSNDCLECAACKAEAQCSVCEDVESCDPSDEQAADRRTSCFAEPSDDSEGGFCARCAPGVEIVVPDVPAGATEVWVIGQIGSSPRIPLTIDGVPDTGSTATGDTGTPPAGSTGDTSGSATGSTGDTGATIP